MIHPALRPVWLVLLFGLLSPFSYAASEPAAVLRNLHQAQVSLQTTASAFHRYQGSEGDEHQLQELDGALGKLREQLQSAVQDLAELGLTAEQEKVQGHWRDTARDLNSAMTAITGSGFAEGQVINGYLLNTLRTSVALKNAYKAVEKRTGVPVSPVLQALRDQTALFQEMAALYMEQNTTQYLYTYRSEADNQDTLDKMAQRFSFGLDDTEKLLAGNPDAIRALNTIRNKWRFLENSFINYNERAVPYLVLKFGGEITADLQALAGEFDRN